MNEGVQLTDSIIYQRSDRVFFSRMPDGQCAILDTEKSIYYGLNAVAARLWELLAEPRRADDLVNALLKEFEVSDNECRRETMRFIDEMTAKALVLRAP